MGSYEADLEENAKLGAGIIKEYLKGERTGSDKIKYASNAITQFNKHLATKGAIDTIKFAVGRSISGSAEELKDFIQGNMPEYGPAKALKE